MKLVWCLCALALCAAGPALAQEDRISVYGDAAGTNCSVADVGGTVSIYIVHESVDGAINSVWMAPIPGCAAMTYASEVYPPGFFSAGGNSQSGFGLQYSIQCKPSTFLICTISATSSGTTPPCCFYPVLPAPFVEPNVGKIHAHDCDNVLFFPTSDENHGINLDATCDCSVPAEASTWGAVKSLYN